MLQLDQGMIGPGDVSRATGAGAEALCRRHHGPDHLRVLAHPEIIVRAPDHHLALTARSVPDGVRVATSDALKIREDAIALLIPQPAQGGGKKCVIVHASLQSGRACGLYWAELYLSDRKPLYLDCCDWARVASTCKATLVHATQRIADLASSIGDANAFRGKRHGKTSLRAVG